MYMMCKDMSTETRNYIPAKCSTCGKPIYPHWKYCQEHTRGNILLDMDTAKPKRVSLFKQENERLWRLLEEEMKAHAILKEQYARLQDNFHDLAEYGVSWYITKLSSKARNE